MRVLDSLRAYWPSLNGRVDLVDLVWLRIIAVTEPALYRWIEEYLTAYAALAAGRVHISEAERTALAKRMDDALAAEGLDWKRMQFELERHLPGLNFHNFNQGKEERLFSKAQRGAHAQDFERARLASPSHSRLYFALVEPPDSVTDTDVAELLEAANGGMNDVAALFLRLSDKRGDAGATKAERLLDQLAIFDEEIVQGWPVEALTLGLVNVADELAKDDAGDDWGYPRVWYLADALLKHLSRVLPEQRGKDLVERLFANGLSLGFISHLLRNETFSHGFYGDRPNASDAITDRATFDTVRSIMVRRYAAGGLHRILAERNAITILYAWSQAGGRDEVVKAVAERTAEDGAFVELMLKICSTSVSSPAATRPSMLLFHILTNRLFAAEHRSPNAQEFLRRHAAEAFSPGPEAVIVGTYMGEVDWPLEEHSSALDRYFEERVRKSGLHAPRILEAAAILALSERVRSGDDPDGARRLIARAVEADPANQALRGFKREWSPEMTVSWRALLLPARSAPDLKEAGGDA
ncbi:hypothetical protein [uncultured Novosphingobium sp.]|uniref:hypothetical protein n=1 Tax=uncultured Novosphingobium sp. TaxID=292277 RepID=UPI0037499BFB